LSSSNSIQLRIIINSQGLEKVELYGQPNDVQSKFEAVELFRKLAWSIHQLSESVNAIVAKNQSKKLNDFKG